LRTECAIVQNLWGNRGQTNEESRFQNAQSRISRRKFPQSSWKILEEFRTRLAFEEGRLQQVLGYQWVVSDPHQVTIPAGRCIRTVPVAACHEQDSAKSNPTLAPTQTSLLEGEILENPLENTAVVSKQENQSGNFRASS